MSNKRKADAAWGSRQPLRATLPPPWSAHKISSFGRSVQPTTSRPVEPVVRTSLARPEVEENPAGKGTHEKEAVEEAAAAESFEEEADLRDPVGEGAVARVHPLSGVTAADLVGVRFVGYVKSQRGNSKFFIGCEETAAAFDGRDVKITWKSDAPPDLQVGDSIEFGVMQEYPDEDWGSPLAVDVVLLGQRRQARAAKQDSTQADDGAFAKSKAVEAFRTAEGKPRVWDVRGSRAADVVRGAAVGPSCKAVKQPGPDALRGREPFQRAFLDIPSLSQADRKTMLDMRVELEIAVEGDWGCEFPPIVIFDELADVLPDYVAEALTEYGIEAPTAVQAQALPLVLSGHDLIGIAKTGSGKTLAYMLPAIVHIEAQQPLAKMATSPIALILVPVRELAMQVADEAQRFLRGSSAGSHGPQGIRAVSLYGGCASNKVWQVASLKKGCHVVAATPGRLVDLMSSHEVSLIRVTFFVLDEADRMLECGFEENVGTIATHIRRDRQTVVFSATWPPKVQGLAKEMCDDQATPVQVFVGQVGGGHCPRAHVDRVQEVVVFDHSTWEERDMKKQELLTAHVREVLAHRGHKAIVFVSRKGLADDLCQQLWKEGYRINALHGGRTQERRTEILEQFKRGEIQLLVTTDVMAHGLDLPKLSHVVLYDMAEIEDYVNRVSLAARGAYGCGHALTFFEYDRKWPKLAGQLAEVLEQSGQDVPQELRIVASEVAGGQRRAKWVGLG